MGRGREGRREEEGRHSDLSLPTYNFWLRHWVKVMVGWEYRRTPHEECHPYGSLIVTVLRHQHSLGGGLRSTECRLFCIYFRLVTELNL